MLINLTYHSLASTPYMECSRERLVSTARNMDGYLVFDLFLTLCLVYLLFGYTQSNNWIIISLRRLHQDPIPREYWRRSSFCGSKCLLPTKEFEQRKYESWIWDRNETLATCQKGTHLKTRLWNVMSVLVPISLKKGMPNQLHLITLTDSMKFDDNLCLQHFQESHLPSAGNRCSLPNRTFRCKLPNWLKLDEYRGKLQKWYLPVNWAGTQH